MTDDGGMAQGMAALLRVIAERDDARNALRGMAARCWMLRQVARESDTALRASDATALRERLAGAIDDAYVLAMERARSAYRDGYCDGLELAEAIVRGTP